MMQNLSDISFFLLQDSVHLISLGMHFKTSEWPFLEEGFKRQNKYPPGVKPSQIKHSALNEQT